MSQRLELPITFLYNIIVKVRFWLPSALWSNFHKMKSKHTEQNHIFDEIWHQVQKFTFSLFVFKKHNRQFETITS